MKPKPITATSESAELAAAVAQMTPQLLIVLVNRAGGAVTIPVAEVDDTGRDFMTMEVIGRDFVFKVERKQ